MLKFLSNQTHRLIWDFLPILPDITHNSVVNYLTFYLSHHSSHLYHSPLVTHPSNIISTFTETKQQSEQTQSNITHQCNVQHLFARMLLSVHFHNHITDQSGSLRLFNSLSQLHYYQKQDIAEQFLKSRCTFLQSNNIGNLSNDLTFRVKEQLPTTKTRNIYIQYPYDLPSPSALFALITRNPLLKVSNLTKILTFKQNENNLLHLPDQLQTLCHTQNIRIKLLQNNTVPQLINFVKKSHNNKTTILVHELVNNDKTLYNVPKQPREQEQNTKNNVDEGYTRSTVDFNKMPSEVVLLCQRLPRQSLIKNRNTAQQKAQEQKRVMTAMRSLLNRNSDQDLLDPSSLTLPQITKNYFEQDIDGQVQETGLGFSLKRYVTSKLFNQRRTDEDFINQPKDKYKMNNKKAKVKGKKKKVPNGQPQQQQGEK